MTGRRLRRLAAPGWLLLAAGPGFALEGEKGPPPTYLRDVKPILDSSCVGCHSRKNLDDADASGGLALDSFEAMQKGGVVKPGDSKGSDLVERLREKDPDSRMPRKAPALSEEKIALIERWIEAGAPRGEPEGGSSGTAPAAVLTPIPPPRFRPARPLDLRIPTALGLPRRLAEARGKAAGLKLELLVRVAPLPPVTALAFAPPGPGGRVAVDLLAAGGYGTVTVWDLARAEAVRALTGVRGAVHAVRFSPDGRFLAMGGGRPGENGSVVVVDTGSWRPAAVFSEHRESVLDLAWSPDGSRLASAGFDRTALVLDPLKQSVELAVREHSDAVYGVAFVNKGLLASAGADRTVKLTDLESGKVVRSLAGHDRAILALAASSGRKLLVSAGVEPALRFWNVEEGKTLRTAGGHSGRVEDVVFSRDGKRLASVGSDRTVRIWNAESGAAEKTLTGSSEWLYSVDFDAAGRRVAAGAWDGTLRIWDLEKGRLLAVLLQPAARDESDLDWAAATPEGYFRASPALLDLSRFAAGPSPAEEIPARTLERALGAPERMAAALRGEAVIPPLLSPERAF